MPNQYLTCGECPYYLPNETSPSEGRCRFYDNIKEDKRSFMGKLASGQPPNWKCFFGFKANIDFDALSGSRLIELVNESDALPQTLDKTDVFLEVLGK